MRDVALVVVIVLGLAYAIRFPYAGILLWVWFACMSPHQEAYGFARTAPLNLIIASVTLGAWLFSSERKLPRFDAAFCLNILFFLWITINGFFAVDPDYSWPIWDRTWKTILLGLLVVPTATSAVRVHALVWTIVVSLMYYGVKGGLFTIITGGHNHVLGPENSIIADNNHLALALLMIMPLANYLRTHSMNHRVSIVVLIAMVLSLFAILGSYSRGAFLALAALALVAWMRSKKKIVYLLAVAAIAGPAFYFMPQSYFDRLESIQSAGTDDSFQGRVMAWKVAWDYAVDHIPLGDGFYGAQLPSVFNRYYPGSTTHAAHSIYFEVLGDNGFFGLALYLSILFVTFANTFKIRRMAKGKPELSWASDLASMIQLSLFVFCIGGAALSMAYYDVFFILVGLTSAIVFQLDRKPDTQAEAIGGFSSPRPAISTAANSGNGRFPILPNFPPGERRFSK